MHITSTTGSQSQIAIFDLPIKQHIGPVIICIVSFYVYFFLLSLKKHFCNRHLTTALIDLTFI